MIVEFQKVQSNPHVYQRRCKINVTDQQLLLTSRQVKVERGAVLKSIVRSKERSSADQNIWFIQVGSDREEMPSSKDIQFLFYWNLKGIVSHDNFFFS